MLCCLANKSICVWNFQILLSFLLFSCSVNFKSSFWMTETRNDELAYTFCYLANAKPAEKIQMKSGDRMHKWFLVHPRVIVEHMYCKCASFVLRTFFCFVLATPSCSVHWKQISNCVYKCSAYGYVVYSRQRSNITARRTHCGIITCVMQVHRKLHQSSAEERERSEFPADDHCRWIWVYDKRLFHAHWSLRHKYTDRRFKFKNIRIELSLSMLYFLKEKIVQPASLTVRARPDSMTLGDTVARARRLRRLVLVYAVRRWRFCEE